MTTRDPVHQTLFESLWASLAGSDAQRWADLEAGKLASTMAAIGALVKAGAIDAESADAVLDSQERASADTFAASQDMSRVRAQNAIKTAMALLASGAKMAVGAAIP